MIKNIIRSFFAVFLMQLLVACGGGSSCDFNGSNCGSGGAGGEEGEEAASKYAITLSLVPKFTNVPITTISADEPGRLVATVTGYTGTGIVSFTTTKGTLSGTTKLLSGGQASVDLTAGSASDAGTATASITIDGTTYSSEVLFEITSTASGIDLQLISAVSGLETTNISISNPGRLVATLDGITKPVIVSFSTTQGTVSNSGSVLSDSLGVATVDLLPGDGSGAGTATASVTVGSVTYTDSVVFQINATSLVGTTLQFITATPETITLKGAGGSLGSSETSVVEFKVLDVDGNPVSGEDVSFELNTSSGGMSLTPAIATSDASGSVRTIVSSGTVATSVRVTASIIGSSPLVSIQSSRLVISTGIPDQDSFSLSASTFSPNSWGYDGITSIITARLADGFNNPVPDGTVVSFQTEGGAIDPFCTTEGGACSVTWSSQNPRPTGGQFTSSILSPALPAHSPKSLGQPYAGRVTITATAIGEESFPDTNGNGRFDASEMALFGGNDVSGRPYDLAEAFTDYNEDGVYNPSVVGESGGALERLVDFNSNTSWDDKDGLYNGSLCSIPAHAGCSSIKTVNVRGSLVLIMSSDTPVVSLFRVIPSSTAYLCISDINNQTMPAGTAVSATFSGSLGKLNEDTLEIKEETVTYSIGDTNSHGPNCFGRAIVSPDDGFADLVIGGVPVFVQMEELAP